MLSKQKVCGDDKYTGKNYDHRRGWVEAQILKKTLTTYLAGFFAPIISSTVSPISMFLLNL